MQPSRMLRRVQSSPCAPRPAASHRRGVLRRPGRTRLGLGFRRNNRGTRAVARPSSKLVTKTLATHGFSRQIMLHGSGARARTRDGAGVGDASHITRSLLGRMLSSTRYAMATDRVIEPHDQVEAAPRRRDKACLSLLVKSPRSRASSERG